MKLWIYGENLTAHVINATSQIPIGGEENNKEPTENGDENTTDANEETELSDKLGSALKLEDEKPKEILVSYNIFPNTTFSIRLKVTQN